MMTLVDAANILYEELSRINVELFSDRHIQFVYNDTYGADVAILSHIAFNNAQRHKMDAMRQYCYNVRKCPGSPFIVTDKAFRLFQEKGMKTSFGSSLQRGEQIYGIANYENTDFGFDPVFLIFNENEFDYALGVIEKLEYLSANYGEESYEYGDLMIIGNNGWDKIAPIQDTFVSIHYPLYEILECGEDPDVYWNILEYV